MLENLKQHRGPLGTYCGKFFFNSSKPFRRYGFPPCTQLFESRTVLVFEWFFKCHSFMLLILFCPKFLRHICLGMVQSWIQEEEEEEEEKEEKKEEEKDIEREDNDKEEDNDEEGEEGEEE